MSCAAGPDIKEDGLVLALDAANTKSILSAVEVLVVAGGGGGGNHHGGGGGGGGLLYSNSQSITPSSAITVTVGAGGAATSYGGGNGGNGGNSVFGALTAIGGGGGGSYPNNGSGGGSGGGSNNWSTSTTGGTGTSGQGFAGGSNNGTTNFGGGGGGAGGTAKGLSNNSGGDGLAYNISGTQTYYSGGGGSGVYPGYANQTSYGFGGLGGGGNGGNGPHGSGTAPTAGGTNTGGGGGGVADLQQNSAAGGSGIVIVRYPGSQRATGGTVTSVAGHTIHTFTTSGTFTPNFGDMSGRGNTGTLTNGPTYNSANGGSLVFDGVNDYITLPSPSNRWSWTPSGSGNNNLTFEMWVNSSDTGGLYFSKPWNGNGEYNYYIGHNSWDNRVNTQSHSLTFSSLATGKWEYVACIVTPTQKAVYRNGVINANFTNHNITENTPGSGNNNLDLAVMTLYPYGEGWGGITGHAISGNVSNFKIYNRVLTAQEIQQNFNATRSRYSI